MKAAAPAAAATAVGTQGAPGAVQGLGIAETGVTVGNTDPALAYYFVLIQDKITGNWTPPKMGPGTTAGLNLSLRILRSGQVRDLAIDASSGDRILDDSALRAVRLSTPLPPLPPLFRAETLYLQLRFTFVGEKS
jgi:protein TonB